MSRPVDLDPDRARRAMAEGIDLAESGSSPEWRERAYATVIDVAHDLPDFTADDIWVRLGQYPATSPYALGAVMQRARREGVVRPTGRHRQSASPTNHRALLVWERAR